MKTLNALEASDDVGLVYGSGFETTPQLLDVIGQSVPVIGNSSQVLRNLKRTHSVMNAVRVRPGQ